tara:strand:+ start:295 stop:477 length:183 start_codon:yes stop_codon:yes gene_type:complete
VVEVVMPLVIQQVQVVLVVVGLQRIQDQLLQHLEQQILVEVVVVLGMQVLHIQQVVVGQE